MHVRLGQELERRRATTKQREHEECVGAEHHPVCSRRCVCRIAVALHVLSSLVALRLLPGSNGERAQRTHFDRPDELPMPTTVEAWSGRRVLITGGLGFIGSNLAIRLVGLGADVAIVDSLIPGYGGNRFNVAPVAERVTVNVSDIRDEHSLPQLLEGRDVIFNLAGQVSHVDSMERPRDDLEINCAAQLSLLEAVRRVSPDARVVFAGSRQQYGRPRFLPLTEDHPLHPIDVNGINKTAGESYHLLYNEVYGLETVSLRLTNTYGPRMLMQHARQGFIAWFVRHAVEGEEIELFGDGSQMRDFNEVEDVVDAFLLAGASDRAVGRVFNLGHPEPVSLRELTETLLDVAGGGSFTTVPFPEDRARIDIGSVYADATRIGDELGWKPRVPLRDGLARMVGYYREHRSRYW
jgi:UDP-glucose 4-epimerase